MNRTNLENTRIDTDLEWFLSALVQKAEVGRGDIQELLDALRIKYDADEAYILEGLTSEEGSVTRF